MMKGAKTHLEMSSYLWNETGENGRVYTYTVYSVLKTYFFKADL